jgi:secondary thiamine-phosphate synthase enzyme
MGMTEIEVESDGFDASYDVTERIQEALEADRPGAGIVRVCVLGSTVGLTIMRYEPGALEDLLFALRQAAPPDRNYAHFTATGDPNGAAHVKSCLVGTSVMAPYRDGKLLCPDTHRIVLIDFDLRRARRRLYIET